MQKIKACGIRQFILSKIPYASFQDTLTITYNSSGNPLKAIRSEPRTGAPNFLFKYNNGRLSDFIGVYSNGITTEFWHRYQYDTNGRVVVDSVYIFATIINGNPGYPNVRYAMTFVYDNQDRIILEKRTYENGYNYERYFQYNTDGNRIGVQYGKNVSFRRTNKIWMLLDRDYSINDRLGSGGFNAFSLPTTINLGDGSTYDVFLGSSYYEGKIEYLCK